MQSSRGKFLLIFFTYLGTEQDREGIKEFLRGKSYEFMPLVENANYETFVDALESARCELNGRSNYERFICIILGHGNEVSDNC